MPNPTPNQVTTATGDVPSLWFEDFEPGRVFDLGTMTADPEEIVTFAQRYDPQWYHLDAARATESQWGGLIASGIWTVSAAMRLYVDGVLAKAAPDASPGMEEVRWLKAVYAGDVLHLRLTVLEANASSRSEDLGTVRLLWVATRDDVPVFRMIGRGWFHRRPAAPPIAAGT